MLQIITKLVIPKTKPHARDAKVVEYDITCTHGKHIDTFSLSKGICLHSEDQGFKRAASTSTVLHGLLDLIRR